MMKPFNVFAFAVKAATTYPRPRFARAGRTGVVSFHEDPPRATQALLKNLRPPWLIGG